jgi:thiamine-monophosphate kinase
MDLSDGLSLDLFRMAAESRVGAEIWAEALPVFPGANREQALHGGEDYELLFTLGSGRQVPRSFEGVPLTAIGVVTRSRRLSLIGPGGRRSRLPVGGFQHKLA